MKKIIVFVLVLAAVLTISLAGCTQAQAPLPTPEPTLQPTPLPATQAPGTVRIVDTSLGKILADPQGKSLYYFANDVRASGASSCNGQCAVIWPVFSPSSVSVSSPLNPADFASITRADGTKQTTYMGRPLYFYSGDTTPGTTNGEGINNVWHVATIAGTVPTIPPTSIPTTSHTLSSSGGGYGGY
jgi:predicted lipoprotein with Yx(FWY)xxD motif